MKVSDFERVAFEVEQLEKQIRDLRRLNNCVYNSHIYKITCEGRNIGKYVNTDDVCAQITKEIQDLDSQKAKLIETL